jgi:hypothetical protein
MLNKTVSTKRTNLSCFQPSTDTVKVKCMITYTPCHLLDRGHGQYHQRMNGQHALLASDVVENEGMKGEEITVQSSVEAPI